MEDAHPYLILVMLWVAYAVLHSLLASQRVKRTLVSAMGRLSRYYRLLYSLVAVVGLLPILFYSALIPRRILLPAGWNDVLTIAGLIAATYGVIIIRLAFKQYSFSQFIGLQQAKLGEEQESFSREGVLALVRHPLYTGSILILLGFWLFSPTLSNLITVSILILYVLIGIRLEERKLVEQYGNAYLEYQKEVPMLVPRRGSLKQLRQ